MILDVIDLGGGRHSLRADGRTVGWVSGHTLGFGGFDTEAEAITAAISAYDALRVWLARQRRAVVRSPQHHPLKVEADTGAIVLRLGAAQIGRVFPLVAESPAISDDEYAFELTVPNTLHSALVISAARMIFAARERRAAIHRIAVDAVGAMGSDSIDPMESDPIAFGAQRSSCA